jgi:hypothetical protein
LRERRLLRYFNGSFAKSDRKKIFMTSFFSLHCTHLLTCLPARCTIAANNVEDNKNYEKKNLFFNEKSLRIRGVG